MADPARSSMKDGRQKPDWSAGVPLLLEVHFDPHLCVSRPCPSSRRRPPGAAADQP